MDTTVLENKVRQTKWLVRPVAETKKKSFEEAVAECNGVSIDDFFDELNARIEKWSDYA